MSAGGVSPAVSGVPSSVNIPPGLLMVVLVFGWVLVLLLCFFLLGVLTYYEPTDGLECSATESSLCEWMEMEDAFSFFVRLRKERPILILSLHAHED